MSDDSSSEQWVKLQDAPSIPNLRFRHFKGESDYQHMVACAPTYDSGWINITDKCGQYFTLTHNLNSANLLIDIVGKVGADGGVHKRYLGGTNYLSGWSKTYGGASDDSPRAVIQTSDGGYALAVWTYSYGAGSCDFWLVKTDPVGGLQWSKTYGGSSIDNAYSVVQASDGGYILAGRTYSFGAGLSDFWLVKTDAEQGLALADSAADTISLYRGITDGYWNFVRVRIWKIQETP